MSEMSVLLVEDNEDDRELAAWVLRKIGLTNITFATDGLEAIKLLHGEGESREATCRPDIIILDLRLPKLDGLDVLRRIRGDARTVDIRVYALTSSEDPYDKMVCAELGVPAFFSKPLKVDAVLQLGQY